MLHTAFAERLQFGRDNHVYVRPVGFLLGGYHPATYLISVVVWLFSRLCLVGGVACHNHFSRNPFVTWLWMLTVIGLANITPF